MFKVGDIVYVSNPNTEYEKEYGERTHSSFLGKITDIEQYADQTCITVTFPQTPNGSAMEWAYLPDELSLASDLKNLTVDEFKEKIETWCKPNSIVHVEGELIWI